MRGRSKTGILPIGPLMIEHRLIERMVALLKKAGEKVETNKTIDTCFLGQAVDFFRSYADRCHHGKEEDILFRSLQTRQLSAGHKEILAGLLADHVRARELVAALANARQQYLQKETQAEKAIRECLKNIVELYTAHIQKEDQQFFIPSMQYFTKDEQAAMLDEFEEFDKMLIHEKYKKLIDDIEKGHPR